MGVLEGDTDGLDVLGIRDGANEGAETVGPWEGCDTVGCCDGLVLGLEVDGDTLGP